MADGSTEIAINTLRFLAVDAVEKANSGHPGMPMGAAAMACGLWTRFLKFDPAAPSWPDRDRFVLSAGHGSMLLYGLLHLSGYDVTLDDIKNFRQWGSKTPGHPEYGHTPGVETTTGPLGQGIAAAVGMAMAENHLAARFNKPGFKVVDHFTYAIAGDGCLMEGVSAEAASLAGHLCLGRLVVLYDDNHITIEGKTDLAFSEDVARRFEAYGWQVITVADGNDLEEISKAIGEAKAETARPSLIKIRTHIGFGSPKKQDSASAHGSPLGKDETAAAKANLGWPAEPAFRVPKAAYEDFSKAAKKGAASRKAWLKLFSSYEKAHPELAKEFLRVFAGELPEGFDSALPLFPADPKGMATRVAGGKALNAVAEICGELFGGSADLAPSNNSLINGAGDYSASDASGRNIRFGVREHAMAAISNGLANHGGIRPYNATFFVFTDYMRPSIRLSALMGAPVIYVMTHDSIQVGEDGPTHQPIEHLMSLRVMPGLSVIRPADANETSVAWKAAIKNSSGPTMLVLSRQNLPVLDRKAYASAEGILKGGYILKEAVGGTPDAILIATGSEVHTALKAAELLEKKKVRARVVNLASWDLFDAQPARYREKVLPKEVTARVSIEAGSTLGWERYTGTGGATIGIDRFGASAPGDKVAAELGITPENAAARVLKLLKK